MSFMHWSTDSIRMSSANRQDATIGVIFFTSRKQPTLMLHTPNMVSSLAYFKDEESARTFCDLMGLNITEPQEPSAALAPSSAV